MWCVRPGDGGRSLSDSNVQLVAQPTHLSVLTVVPHRHRALEMTNADGPSIRNQPFFFAPSCSTTTATSPVKVGGDGSSGVRTATPIHLRKSMGWLLASPWKVVKPRSSTPDSAVVKNRS